MGKRKPRHYLTHKIRSTSLSLFHPPTPTKMIDRLMSSKSRHITTLVTSILVFMTGTDNPAVMGQSCQPSGRIMTRRTPPGKCANAQCCAVGQTYATYFCSPPVTNSTAAVLNLSGFEKGEDGGGRARCDNKYHSDDTPVVALSTGWFNDAVHCEQVILIRGNGGRTAQAVVVDECNSHVGCDNSSDYRPPCPNNVLAASKAVWAALGVPENSSLYGEMDVTWSPANKTNPLGSYQLSQKHRSKMIVVGIIVPLVPAALVIIGLVVCIHKRRRRWKELDEERWENSLVLLSELPKRFTYNDLKLSTDNFNEEKKLGVGGFGSVFEGTLNDQDRTRVAVKRLDRFKQGQKEFLTEVKTTGRVHHFNLVKLIGFCAEKEHRLLVYEYMSNGSLDKWIFRNNEGSLDWVTRKRIILHIAKGLSYLHEDCKSKIIHLDIKPQNILLDHDYNAKLADFGMAKLADKEESFVVTQMRGTRGYLAPEWLSRKITEKVDVYSYGIVVLEVVFQRRNFNVRQQEDPTLVEIVREKLDANQLCDVIEECCDTDEEMRNNIGEVEKMIKLAIWCLQKEPARRPSMSIVVRVLEGTIALEHMIDSSYATLIPSDTPVEISSNATFDVQLHISLGIYENKYR